MMEPCDPWATMLEPARRRILQHLRTACPTVSDLAAATDLTPSNLSHHLAQLRQAGLVRFERQGKCSCYELAGPHVEALLAAMDQFERAHEVTA